MKPVLKTSRLLFCTFCFFFTPGKTQVWTYDFGTSVGVDTAATASTTFLPAPLSGTARVRVGAGTTAGSITLSNPGITTLGSGSELQIRASLGSVSPTKFSVHDYTPAKVGYVKFRVSFSGGTDGVYNFSLGDGSSYNDNSAVSSTHIFAAIRWSFGAFNKLNYQVLNGGSYGTTGISNAATLFVQGYSYTTLYKSSLTHCN